MLRPVAIADPECLIRPLCTLLIEQGRPDEALAVSDDIAAQSGPNPSDLRMYRIEVLVERARTEQAIADLQTDPDAETG